ncbi:MAG: glycosyltransferase family 2 protein [Patescibacteria group bacterium]|nr:glycosyltransferase family 2 protein [Patescibacteria group bacterium]
MGLTKKKLVSIIIVTRNRQKIVEECLKSVYKTNYPNFEIILVDNGSSDETVPVIRKKFPQVKIVRSEQNLGANKGKNLGQKQAKGDYFLFLDSDTTVAKNFLSALVLLAEKNPQAGIICPKMYYYDQKTILWYAGVKMNLLTSQTQNIGSNEGDHGQYDQVRETLFAPTAYLAKKEVVKKLKGHDEIFFMTYGETDYGFRARKAGFKILFCPEAKLWHRLGQEENTKSIRGLGFNMPMRAYYFARNRVIFMKRHSPPKNFTVFITIFFPLATMHMIYATIKYGGGWTYLRPYLEGTWDGVKFLFTKKVNNNHWT